MTTAIYRICVKGHLPPAWAPEFYGMQLKGEENGCTSLTGPIVDQAALYGILFRIRDLGLTLISVNLLPLEFTEAPSDHGY